MTLLCKKEYIAKFKEVKAICNVATFCKEGYGLKWAILLVVVAATTFSVQVTVTRMTQNAKMQECVDCACTCMVTVKAVLMTSLPVLSEIEEN
jgi:hypothetical protein